MIGRPLLCCLALMFVLLSGTALNAQGLVVNEFSNGPAGAQEYFEFVVVGPPLNPNCGPVDIRNWIIDDNNGDFSCGACAGTGIAAGHIKFGNLPVWAAVPTGSIIVVYDPAVKNPRVPADDPADTSPVDGVYILPTSHASLDVSTTPCGGGSLPTGTGACGTCTGNPNYAGACYTAGLVTSNIGLRNSGDAAQVRRPGGVYYHGIGYGTGASLITGGPSNIFFSGDGTGMYYAFNNSISNNYYLAGNFNAGTVASLGETPGLANGANNAAWIASLKLGCPFGVSYAQPLAGVPQGPSNVLTWATGTEVNALQFAVERSHDPSLGFEQLATVTAVGNSSSLQTYSFTDIHPEQAGQWYRLTATDLDGQSHTSAAVEVFNPNALAESMVAWPNPTRDILHIRAVAARIQRLGLYDAVGRLVMELPITGDVSDFECAWDVGHLHAGIYHLMLETATGKRTVRIDLLGE